jgi:hypothetical protein
MSENTSQVRVLFGRADNESGMQMTTKRFGNPPQRQSSQEILSTDGPSPGLGWTVSEKTLREIEEIEANSRAAEQQSGSVVFG